MIMLESILLTISIVLTVIVALVVVLKARAGAKRGAYVAPIHLGSVLLSATLAFILTGVFTGMLLSSLAEISLIDFLREIELAMGETFDPEIHEMIASFDPAVISYVAAIPAALFSPFIFFLLYIFSLCKIIHFHHVHFLQSVIEIIILRTNKSFFFCDFP